jgi:hypothetical protein
MDVGGLGDKAEQLADDRTGGKYDEQTDKAGDMADKRIGRPDDGQSGA